MVGAGTGDANGLSYRALIEGLLDDPSYFKLTVTAFDLSAPAGSVDIDIEVMEEVPDLTGMVLRAAITEDNVYYNGSGPIDYHEDVNRDVLSAVPITVDNIGEIQHVHANFPVDPTWVQAELKIGAFIQCDGPGAGTYETKNVLTSVVTRPTPDYSLRYFALGERVLIGPTGQNFSFDFFHVYNLGNLSDTYTATVEIVAPDGWTAVLCGEGTCYGPTYQQVLSPGEHFPLKVEGEALSSGFAEITVTLSQANGAPGRERTLSYMYMTDDLDVLLVDDDGADSFEDYFIDVLQHYDESYAVWNRGTQPVSSDILSEFPVVIWNVGLAYPTLDDDDRAALGTYLDGGGKLFMTGQDIGWELNDIGGAAYQWYQNYLHARFISDDTNDYTLSGVANDPISHGLDLVIQGGDGANNQAYPSDIDPADGSARVIWTYDANRNGAIRADTGVYRVVYLAFGFEAVNSPATRRACLRRSIGWLRTGQSDVADGGSAHRAFLGSYPSPAPAGATLRFTLPAAGDARLQIFAPDGRLVRTLADGWRSAGTHSVAWDRADDRGARLPAGVYLGRLTGRDVMLNHRLVVLD